MDEIGQISLNASAADTAAAGAGTAGAGAGTADSRGGGSSATLRVRVLLSSATLDLDAAQYLPLVLHDGVARNQKLGLAMALVQVRGRVQTGEELGVSRVYLFMDHGLSPRMWGLLSSMAQIKFHPKAPHPLPPPHPPIHFNLSRLSLSSSLTLHPSLPPQAGAWDLANVLMDRLTALGLPPAAHPPLCRALCDAAAVDIDKLHSSLVPK